MCARKQLLSASLIVHRRAFDAPMLHATVMVSGDLSGGEEAERLVPVGKVLRRIGL